MEIYITKTDYIYNISSEILNSFKKRELKNEEKQKIHSFTYYTLDKILNDIYKIKDRTLSFERKKPVLSDNKKQFSISHSGKYIVIAISDYNCGVDIEQIKNRDYKSISKRMKFETNSLEDFYKHWTEYEALYKLNSEQKNKYQIKFENYILTALSENHAENFQIYIQNEKDFSKLII